MYLKRLEMQGFKSFAKKADLHFSSPITIVVGPNGSGKSNIVDAIRWVLGEGSAKSLRGSKMEDIIFSGSIDKKPLGLAQVSLTLDNSDGSFPVDFTEIKITRKLYRSGESEYLINNNRCRQKDIHELLLDTGVGKDGFSIISQGKVDQILLSQAEEKRMMIEEVAGISKYRYRKSEAKRKLNDTEQSLLRIKDIIFELENQKEPLREQSQKAKAYKTYKQELDKWEIDLASQTLFALRQKTDAVEGTLAGLGKQSLQVETRLHNGEADIERIALLSDQLSAEAGHFQGKIYETGNRISELKSQATLSLNMQETLSSNQFRSEAELSETLLMVQQLEEKAVRENQLLTAVATEYQELLHKIQAEETGIAEFRSREEQAAAAIQEIKSSLFDQAVEQSENHNRKIDLEKQEAVLLARQNALREKLDLANSSQQEAEKRFLDKKQEEESLEKNLDNLKESLAVLQAEISALQGKMAHEITEISAMEKEEQAIEARKRALEELEKNREGYSLGVKSIFQNPALKGITGTVSDLVTTEEDYQLALETALGSSLQHIVTQDDQAAKVAIDFLRDSKKGRCTFLPLKTLEKTTASYTTQKISGLQRALDLVRYTPSHSPVFLHLLSGVYVADTMEQALAINGKLARPVRIVTRNGEIIDARGSMTGGSYRSNQQGLLQRKHEILALEEKKHALSRDREEKQSRLHDLEEALGKKQEILGLHLEKNQTLQYQLGTLREMLREARQSLGKMEDDAAVLQDHYSELCSQLEENSRIREELGTALSLLQGKKEKMEGELSSLIVSQEEQKSLAYQKEKQLSEIRLHFRDIKNKKENAEQALSEIRSQLLTHRQKEQKFTEELKDISEKIQQYQEKAKRAEKEIVQEELQYSLLEKQAEEALQKKQEADIKRKSLEDEVKKLRKELESLREEVHKQEVLLEKFRTESGSLKEMLEDKFQISWEDVLPGMLEECNERQAKNRIRELRKLIDDLGDVNLMAIGEYEKLLERYEFLTTQCEDLDQAKDALHTIIQEMDQIIVRKFKETFQKLNQAFGETFVEMFGGGHAAIAMSDKDNVLETGVEIIAQPPGKTPKHLSLLSGGEKAMTAICLLFAILKIKPGPFCILDEIEASLDEANVNRFAKFLKKFADVTQFIVISHRKGTMEAADVLYGVTMEEKGVSSLISVRISDTIKLTS